MPKKGEGEKQRNKGERENERDYRRKNVIF